MCQFRTSQVTVPDHCHPIGMFICQEMRRQRAGYCDVAERSGIDRNTIRAWRTRNSPTLAGVEAVLGALGYELRGARKPETQKAGE